MKNIDPQKKSRVVFWSALAVFFTGIHSIFLGLIIYFYTDFFYSVFFAASVENIFFVRQSGIFLFLAGLFYLYPLLNLKIYCNLILLIIVSKIVAVIFLISNATYTAAPEMIYLAAFFDGFMGVVLGIVYIRLQMNRAPSDKYVTDNERAGVKEAA